MIHGWKAMESWNKIPDTGDDHRCKLMTHGPPFFEQEVFEMEVFELTRR